MYDKGFVRLKIVGYTVFRALFARESICIVGLVTSSLMGYCGKFCEFEAICSYQTHFS